MVPNRSSEILAGHCISDRARIDLLIKPAQRLIDFQLLLIAEQIVGADR